ncbi:MAG: glycosyltransferase [Bacteroidia bacterium]|nr:glycosyltransferase [Bacteroidia bacterium]
MFELILIPLLSYILIQIWQLTWLIKYKTQKYSLQELPHISIWVACRNEEDNIAGCLNSLLQLDYPVNRIQILVGNDQSTDKTAEIVLQFTQEHPHIQLINIVEDDRGLKAKARVMAQLDQHAVGDYYLITDADVRVKPQWAKAMLQSLDTNTGVSSGTTMVKSDGTDGWLQEMDWAYFMGLLNVISYSGVPATAVGNNMIVRKEAYWQTGGYANIRFSITEDYKLYSEVCAKGWGWSNVMHPDVLAYSEKTKGFMPLLHQRKRWLSGGKELPWYWWILFGIYGSFFFLIPTLFFLAPSSIVLLIWLTKWFIQTAQISIIYKKVGEPLPKLSQFIVYEMYLFILTISTALFFLLPIKTRWKERSYKV